MAEVAEFTVAFSSPIGWIGVLIEQDQITRLSLLETRPETSGAPRSDLVAEVESQLEAYFTKAANCQCNLPLNPPGTPFQKKVWEQLQSIPPGKTCTYGQLAKRLQTSPRAVGGACRQNPIPLLIPCHRVVAVNGDGGFAGHRHGRWLEIKRWLLRHEC